MLLEFLTIWYRPIRHYVGWGKIVSRVFITGVGYLKLGQPLRMEDNKYLSAV